MRFAPSNPGVIGLAQRSCLAAILACAVFANAAHATDAAAVAQTSAGTASTEAPPLVDSNVLGVSLLAAGGALATASVAFSTLAVARSTPDNSDDKPNEFLLQTSGLVTSGLVATGVALLLVGGVFLAFAEQNEPDPKAPTDPS